MQNLAPDNILSFTKVDARQQQTGCFQPVWWVAKKTYLSLAKSGVAPDQFLWAKHRKTDTEVAKKLKNQGC
jgi:hypothetical protein